MNLLVGFALLVSTIIPTIISVEMNDGVEIAVTEAEGLSVPTQDDTLGYIDQYPQPLFVAHDYLAGDHVMNMMDGGNVIIKYSNGTEEMLRISGYLDLGFDTIAERQYVDEGCFYFQTCYNTGIRTVIACKIEP